MIIALPKVTFSNKDIVYSHQDNEIDLANEDLDANMKDHINCHKDSTTYLV